MVNQKYTVCILLQKENILKGSAVYKANEIFQETETVGNYTPPKEVQIEIEGASNKDVSIYIVIFVFILIIYEYIELSISNRPGKNWKGVKY